MNISLFYILEWVLFIKLINTSEVICTMCVRYPKLCSSSSFGVIANWFATRYTLPSKNLLLSPEIADVTPNSATHRKVVLVLVIGYLVIGYLAHL